jgi:hypothetical protein
MRLLRGDILAGDEAAFAQPAARGDPAGGAAAWTTTIPVRIRLVPGNGTRRKR